MRRQETALANACLAGVIAAVFGCASMTVQAQDLKKYDSSTKDFWLKPPPDWFLGDENKEQKGQAPNPGQPTPTPRAELDKILATIKLPPGFKIAVWASGVPQARQMAWGDKGTLFVGTFDKGTVHAVTGPDGQKVTKPFVTGLRMPTGVAFQDGALYVVDIDKLYRYDNPEANLEKAPEGKVV
jgi:glucose/arabinose dehydrogenase